MKKRILKDRCPVKLGELVKAFIWEVNHVSAVFHSVEHRTEVDAEGVRVYVAEIAYQHGDNN